MPGLYVTVEFEDVGPYPTDYPHRLITLAPPNWEAPIGRSTSSYQGPQASANNALFNSRVISRDHAVIKANPQIRTVTIEDKASMHGIRIAGRRLQPYQPEPLYDGCNVILGAEVERVEQDGSISKFSPIQIRTYCSWSDYGYGEQVAAPAFNYSRNSFTADYSDEEPITPYDSEEEVLEDRRSPSVLEVSRTFAVPSSDVSDDEVISILSDDDGDQASNVDSPTSSPVGSLDLAQGNGLVSKATEDSKATPMTPIDVSDDESYYEDSSIFEGDVGDEDHASSMDEEQERSVPQLQSNISVEIPVNKVQREPSPSEVAMAKPTIPKSPPFSRSAPSIYNTRTDVCGDNSAASSFSNMGRSDSAWAGYKSVLYEPMPLSPSMARPWTQNSYLEPLPSMVDEASAEPLNSYNPYGIPPPSEMSSFRQDLSRNMPKEITKETSQLATSSLTEVRAEERKTSDEPTGTGPMTFACDHVETLRQLKFSRKRKADQMITAEPIVIEESMDESSTLGKGKQKANEAVNVPLASGISMTPLVEIVKSPALSSAKTLESLKKKAKKSKIDSGVRSARRGSTFAQLAGTAVASMAIGAVGAVVGLAALPEHFFG